MGRNTRKEPDLTSLSKKLTSQRLECADEIKSLMECMAVRGAAVVGGVGGEPLGCRAVPWLLPALVSRGFAARLLGAAGRRQELGRGRWGGRGCGVRLARRRRREAADN
jgi:hypothetical protein